MGRECSPSPPALFCLNDWRYILLHIYSRQKDNKATCKATCSSSMTQEPKVGMREKRFLCARVPPLFFEDSLLPLRRGGQRRSRFVVDFDLFVFDAREAGGCCRGRLLCRAISSGMHCFIFCASGCAWSCPTPSRSSLVSLITLDVECSVWQWMGSQLSCFVCCAWCGV